MLYVDTSALVALIVPEPGSAAVARWYGCATDELASAVWCVTEFASALGIKQRTGQLSATQAQQAWQRFEQLTTHDLTLLPVTPGHFHRAALLTLDAATALRAGDALHLACAEQAGAGAMVTLDSVLARNAQRLNITPVDLT